MITPKVKLTVHKDVIVIDGFGAVNLPRTEFVPAGPVIIGCILIHADRYLGISKEAKEWLDKVPKGQDDSGDFDSFLAGNDKVFGWLGPVRTYKESPKQLQTSRTWGQWSHHQAPTIPNETDPILLRELDKLLGKRKR